MPLSLKSFIPAALGLSLAGCNFERKPPAPETDAYCIKTGPVDFEIKLIPPNPKAPTDLLFTAKTFYNRHTDAYVGEANPDTMMSSARRPAHFRADLNKKVCIVTFADSQRIYSIK